VVRQDKSKPGRITPKGTAPVAGGAQPGGIEGSSGVSREPVQLDGPSPVVVPIVMFGSFAIGVAIILFNYLTEDILGTPNNWYLLGGLGMVLVGIIAATQYR
jgi:hypothetical protein